MDKILINEHKSKTTEIRKYMVMIMLKFELAVAQQIRIVHC